MEVKTNQRILLLTTSRSYRGQAFIRAAQKLDIEIIQGIDTPEKLADLSIGGLALDFNKPDDALLHIRSYDQQNKITAVLAIDDSGGALASEAGAFLGLPHNTIMATKAAQDKGIMRQMLRKGQVPSPWSQRFSTADDPAAVARQVPYPNVVKPLNMNGSRGVIRSNNEKELLTAIERIKKVMRSVQSDDAPCHFLVESYISGVEVAVEGLIDNGKLHILTLFDKPDPLEGPYFEETIYVTPSRHSQETQLSVENIVAEAALAVGLNTGPIHAEVRINEEGPWIVEIAGRSIGGLCSETLQFGMASTLEELILRQACGLPWQHLKPANDARGVMMIPIPEKGLLRKVEGIEEACRVGLISDLKITAPLNYPLIPLPEGDAYLGFIFARGETPAEVEDALRLAHSKLRIVVDPLLPIINT